MSLRTEGTPAAPLRLLLLWRQKETNPSLNYVDCRRAPRAPLSSSPSLAFSVGSVAWYESGLVFQQSDTLDPHRCHSFGAQRRGFFLDTRILASSSARRPVCVVFNVAYPPAGWRRSIVRNFWFGAKRRRFFLDLTFLRLSFHHTTIPIFVHVEVRLRSPDSSPIAKHKR